MFRALIVEDEDLTRAYLAEKLNELCPEWEAAATAADGMEAVEKLAHEHFDAVVTDIRMPGMDGLELARYIRRADAELPILILSGYDEFDYARAAVRLNVFDYLLKPLNEDELSSALSAMAEQAAARLAAAGSPLLAAALRGEAEAERALLLQHAPCALALLAPAYRPADEARAERLKRLAEDAYTRFAPLCVRQAERTAILIPTESEGLTETVCRATLERFTQADPDCRGGYAAVGAEGLAAAAAKAGAALRLALALDVPAQSAEWMYEQRSADERLRAMLRNLNEAIAGGTLTEERRAALLDRLTEFPEGARVTAAIALLSACDADPAACKSALSRLRGGDAAAEWAAALDELFTRRREDAETVSHLVRRSRDYLQLHFAEPVSLSGLAEHFGVTPAYLSSLFHREMGESYSQYLLQLRMEEAARRMLAEPDAKIYDVGRAVGFYSAKHFTHVFGRYFGLSPSKYREKKTK